MNILEQIINCQPEEVDKIVTNIINEANDNSTKIEQLGFLNSAECNNLFKGFIPLNTKIKYNSIALETYSMGTTDYFYDFANFLRKNNIKSIANVVYNLEYYINQYFGYPSKVTREHIFNDIAWNTTTTDEEYFKALENNKIGDLKGTGAAQCTERSALAQQLLSFLGMEVYYCMGCIDLGYKQEAHCFNIFKRKNDYALLDYSMPVTSYDKDGKACAFYPFVGELTKEEFEEFILDGKLKNFNNYHYINGNQKVLSESERTYVVGSYVIEKQTEKLNINSHNKI